MTAVRANTRCPVVECITDTQLVVAYLNHGD